MNYLLRCVFFLSAIYALYIIECKQGQQIHLFSFFFLPNALFQIYALCHREHILLCMSRTVAAHESIITKEPQRWMLDVRSEATSHFNPIVVLLLLLFPSVSCSSPPLHCTLSIPMCAYVQCVRAEQ